VPRLHVSVAHLALLLFVLAKYMLPDANSHIHVPGHKHLIATRNAVSDRRGRGDVGMLHTHYYLHDGYEKARAPIRKQSAATMPTFRNADASVA
jgi:hypothetical protein